MLCSFWLYSKVIQICISVPVSVSILFQILFHCRLLQGIEYSSPFYMAGPCFLCVNFLPSKCLVVGRVRRCAGHELESPVSWSFQARWTVMITVSRKAGCQASHGGELNCAGGGSLAKLSWYEDEQEWVGWRREWDSSCLLGCGVSTSQSRGWQHSLAGDLRYVDTWENVHAMWILLLWLILSFTEGMGYVIKKKKSMLKSSEEDVKSKK